MSVVEQQVQADQQISLMDRLKTETRAAHADTESVPFNGRMISGQLPLQKYIAQLACLLEVHLALESTIEESHHQAVRQIWREDLAKVPLLRRDLAFFRHTGEVQIDSRARGAISDCVRDINLLATVNPVALLGVLYVLEGSTLGGTILRKHLASAFGLEHDGLAYYTPYGNLVMPHWQQFKSRMNEANLNGADQQAVIDAAQATFAHIKHILLALSA